VFFSGSIQQDFRTAPFLLCSSYVFNYNIVKIVEDITLSVAKYIENREICLTFDTDKWTEITKGSGNLEYFLKPGK
jgi:hypothetical protein